MAKKKSKPGQAKLVSYIKNALKQGYERQRIFTDLLKCHWPRYAIDDAWKLVRGQIRKQEAAARIRAEKAKIAAMKRREAERKKREAAVKRVRQAREKARKRIEALRRKEAKRAAAKKKAKRREAMRKKKEAAREKSESKKKSAMKEAKREAEAKAESKKKAAEARKAEAARKEATKREKGERLIKKIFPKFRKPRLKKDEFIKIGLEGFDELFDKGYGIPKGTTILIEGGPGSGKTIFCLATVVGLCRQGKKCLYMSFEEPEERLMGHMKRFNWPAEQLIKKDMLRIKRFEAIDVSRSVEALLSAAKKELLIEVDPVLFPADYKPDFVVIDSLTSIASAFSGHESRFRIYMEQLFRYLERNRITTFLIREVATPTHVGRSFQGVGSAVSFLADGIVILYNVIYTDGKRGFAMEILKVRGSSFKRRIVKMEIVKGKGLKIHPEKILKRGKQKGFSLT